MQKFHMDPYDPNSGPSKTPPKFPAPMRMRARVVTYRILLQFPSFTWWAREGTLTINRKKLNYKRAPTGTRTHAPRVPQAYALPTILPNIDPNFCVSVVKNYIYI